MKNNNKTITSIIKEKFASERGEIGDGFMTVIAGLLALTLMLGIPLISMSERTDNISQQAAQTATVVFVNKVGTTGLLTKEALNEYISTISSDSNTYDYELVIQHIDENPGIKVTQAQITKIGENLYYNEYTSQIEERLEKNGKIVLKNGDIFSVSYKNTNRTIADMLSGRNNQSISGKHATTVSVNGASN